MAVDVVGPRPLSGLARSSFSFVVSVVWAGGVGWDVM